MEGVEELLDPRIVSLARSEGLEELNQIQRMAIPDILTGKNVVVVAPNGSGKTEASILPVLNSQLSRESKGISILYITPLRALNRDILKRMAKWAENLSISAEIRHGDTGRSQRRRQALEPPDLLVTTPETLQALLVGKRLRSNLSGVKAVIIDELHAIMGSKRGVQLSLALERLEVVSSGFQRIALSATLADPGEAGKLICGPRPFKVKSWVGEKSYEIRIEYPEPEVRDLDLADDLFSSPEAAARIRRMKELVESHRSVLIFANARTLTEMLGHRLSSVIPSAVHHGSISREERESAEDGFKAGEIPALVCTSTLELGIDIGQVDYVVQYMSPMKVSSFVQRFGRSGHMMGKVSRGSIICTSSEQIRESIAICRLFLEGRLEHISIHENPLDVLSHQIAGMVMDGLDLDVKGIYQMIVKAHPYRNIGYKRFMEVVHFMEGLGTIAQSGIRLQKTENTWKYYFDNMSMIPDERRYPILDDSTGRIVGNLGEEFVALTCEVGLDFICRGKIWRINEMGADGLVHVSPSDQNLGAIPGWDGELPPVPHEVAQKTAALSRDMDLLEPGLHADDSAMDLAEEEMEVERDEDVLPNPKQLLLEVYDRFLVIHSPQGTRINQALRLALEGLLRESSESLSQGLEIMGQCDPYRVMFEFATVIDLNWLKNIMGILIDSAGEVEKIVDREIDRRFPFPLKHVAARFGAIPRNVHLFDPVAKNLVEKYQNTPIYEEGVREGKTEKLDVPGLARILMKLSDGEMEIRFLERSAEIGPSSRARGILDRFSAVPELEFGATREASEKIKSRILRRRKEIRCFECGKGKWMRIGELPDEPRCDRCGSRFLTIPADADERLVLKLRNSESEIDNREVLGRLKRKADLVSIYGIRAVTALSVRGIGPQTAARILSKMHDDDQGFIADLMRAKGRYEATRDFWD